jgi:hypothetical protein
MKLKIKNDLIIKLYFNFFFFFEIHFINMYKKFMYLYF